MGDDEIELHQDVARGKVGHQQDLGKRRLPDRDFGVARKGLPSGEKNVRDGRGVDDFTGTEFPFPCNVPQPFEVAVGLQGAADLPLAGQNGNSRLRITQQVKEKDGVPDDFDLAFVIGVDVDAGVREGRQVTEPLDAPQGDDADHRSFASLRFFPDDGAVDEGRGDLALAGHVDVA